MKKASSWIVIVSLLAALCPAEGPAGALEGHGVTEEGELVRMYTNKWAVVPKRNQAPVIDGIADEAVWVQAAVLDDFRTAYHNEAAVDSPVYTIAYDDAGLYVAGSLAQVEKEALAEVDIIISPDTHGDRHYVATIPVTPPAMPMNTDWNPDLLGDQSNRNRISITSFTVETSESGGQFRLEAAIPWSAFGTAAPAPGDEWRMNIMHLHRLNTRTLSSWVPIRTSSFWDTGGSVTVPVNTVDQGRLGSVYFDSPPAGEAWTPEEPELRYLDFARKELEFKTPSPEPASYALAWKGPTGDWEQLQQAGKTAAGGRTSLIFEHPPVLEDGHYELRLHTYGGVPANEFFTVFSFDRDELIRAGIAGAAQFPPAARTPVTSAPASQRVETLLELVPDKIGFRFAGLPEMPELNPDDLYSLSADRKSLVSKKTGTVYPNAAYPEAHTQTAVNKLGQTMEYPYYEDNEGRRYFLSAHLWYLQKNYVVQETENVSKTDPLGAARLLYRFAERYEGYVPVTDYNWHTYPINWTAGPPFNYWGGMWNRWYISDLASLQPLLRAFETVRKTDALEVLSQEVGEDVEAKLVESMLVPSADFVLGYTKRLGNMNASAWRGLIDAGKALGQPDYIHKTVEWIREYVDKQFLADGFWNEVTLSYHIQSTEGVLGAVKQLEGWSDPPGYESPRSGVRYDNLQMAAEYPITEKAKELPNLLAYPNGHVLPIQDTWANQRAEAPDVTSGSLLLPAAGIGKLASGEGESQTQLYLQFSPKYGHTHYDPLNLNLYAQGQELLPDLGYTYTKYRYFTLSTLGHNTVVVNSKNMMTAGEAKHGGTIEAFVPNGGPFQAIRASETNAYPETDEYSREPWFVPFGGGNGSEGYVLDIFRVSGGGRHEYTLQGDANRDAVFRTDLPLEPYGPRLLPPGTEAAEAETFQQSGTAEGHYPAYIYVKDVQRAELQDDRYTVTLVTYDSGAEQAKLRITGLLEDGDNELYLGRSPSLRSTRVSGRALDTNDEAVKHYMPKLVLRREGTDLTSTFVTAMEPYSGTAGPVIEAVDRLEPDAAPEGAVAVQVSYGDTTDLILSSPRHPAEALVVGDVTMRGEMGMIRTVNGVITKMVLVGGTLLKKGERELTGSGTVTGTIASVKRLDNGDGYNGFVTGTPVAPEQAAALRNRYVIVTHPDGSAGGYRIKDIRTESGSTAIELADQDPGFEMNGDGSSEMAYFPGKRWTGIHTFAIANLEIEDNEALRSVTLDAAKRHLLQGETVRIAANGASVDGSAIPLSRSQVSFASSNPGILKVDEEGNVTAVGEGAATITAEASANGGTATASVMMSGQARLFRQFDAVDLPILEQTAATQYFPQYNMVRFEAADAGQHIRFGFETPGTATADYDVGIKTYKGGGFGKYRIGIDGADQLTYDFFSQPSVIGTEFEPLGTIALTPGSHSLELTNDGKASAAYGYRLGLIQLLLSERMNEPPGLHAAGYPVYTGEEAAFTFADDPDWRADVSGLTVNGTPLPPSAYTLTAGGLTIAPGVLTEPGRYWIVVQSAGYRHAAIEQFVTSNAALTALTVDPGLLYPAFAPQRSAYAAAVGPDVEEVSVTAVTYQPDAVVNVAGHVYGTGMAAPIGLHAGTNSVAVAVYAPNGETSNYTLDIYRAHPELIRSGTVTGAVYDPYGNPLAGVPVRLIGPSARSEAVTDEAGSFSIANVPAGYYRVKASRMAGSGMSALFKVEAAQTAVTTVTVIDTSPPQITGASVQYAATGDPVQAASSKNGHLYLVPSGTGETAAELAEAAAAPGGAAAAATAGITVTLDTYGFAAGLYNAYAVDTSGNVSAPKPVSIISRDLALLDDPDPVIAYSGAWTKYTSANYAGGSLYLANQAGASVDLPFYGTRAEWVGMFSSNGGMADLYIDRQLVQTVDTYRPGVSQYQATLYDTGALPPGVHVLTVVVKGERHPSSTGGFVRFDGLRLFGY
ncbi:hemoblobin-interacting domain-containing protein [Paenibacillus oceani]|uniref:Cadherin-like beta sandwich domain-containing protein n=1 Tax=Paenibacillus oceani TaxID=2772510 RepID=A0A927CE63_9BACL|nr:cadherin-like beta sandwich domain-containing protein [Paenibacillus oceani]MBD2864952.1 cadherin-like beta sandwich domain-containing protein [Paenibacillus oceani]